MLCFSFLTVLLCSVNNLELLGRMCNLRESKSNLSFPNLTLLSCNGQNANVLGIKDIKEHREHMSNSVKQHYVVLAR